MGLSLHKRYAAFYMATGKVKVAKARSKPDTANSNINVFAPEYVAKMLEPMKASAAGASEHTARRALAARVASEVRALLEARKPVPLALPKGSNDHYLY